MKFDWCEPLSAIKSRDLFSRYDFKRILTAQAQHRHAIIETTRGAASLFDRAWNCATMLEVYFVWTKSEKTRKSEFSYHTFAGRKFTAFYAAATCHATPTWQRHCTVHRIDTTVTPSLIRFVCQHDRHKHLSESRPIRHIIGHFGLQF